MDEENYQIPKATVIDDWDFFLPRDHIDKPVRDKDNPEKYKRYRIFEPHWKEVILLWLGRDSSEDFRQQKQELIEALIRFEDGYRECCFGYKGFYEYRAYFLAAAGIIEFQECSWAEEIVKQVFKRGFGEFNFKYNLWQSTYGCLCTRSP
jgi:hypothetical protein